MCNMRLWPVVLVGALLLSCPGDVYSVVSNDRKQFCICDLQGPTLYDIHIPILKMFKRQVRNFQKAQRASITLVFRSSLPVMVRWFKKAPDQSMGNSEVQGMLPIEGDPVYKMGYVRSGDVIATSLIIANFSLSFPQEYETILTSEDGNLQYQLRTTLQQPIEFTRDDIDSPEWLAVPPPAWKFREQQHLKLHCKVFVPNDIPPKLDGANFNIFTNELIMHHAKPDPNSEKTCMTFEPVLRIHKDTWDFAEKNEHILYQAERKSLKNHHAIYNVKMTTYNATQTEFEGVYQCAMRRENDRLYIISEITVYGKKSPLPTNLRAEIIPCNGEKLHKSRRKPGYIPRLLLYHGEETCFRCRGMGHPRPQVAVFQPNNAEMMPTPGIGVNKYINVRDGGVSEVTITVRNVKSLMEGLYECKVYNIDSHAKVQPFRVDIKHRCPSCLP